MVFLDSQIVIMYTLLKLNEHLEGIQKQILVMLYSIF